MKLKSIGYGVYGQGPFQPDFTVCKKEGGTANCPSEYVKEFGALGQVPQQKCSIGYVWRNPKDVGSRYSEIFCDAGSNAVLTDNGDNRPDIVCSNQLNGRRMLLGSNYLEITNPATCAPVPNPASTSTDTSSTTSTSTSTSVSVEDIGSSSNLYYIGGGVLALITLWILMSLVSFKVNQ